MTRSLRLRTCVAIWLSLSAMTFVGFIALGAWAVWLVGKIMGLAA